MGHAAPARLRFVRNMHPTGRSCYRSQLLPVVCCLRSLAACGRLLLARSLTRVASSISLDLPRSPSISLACQQGGVADKAGLRVGDVVWKVDGEDLPAGTRLASALDGRRHTLSVAYMKGEEGQAFEIALPSEWCSLRTCVPALSRRRLWLPPPLHPSRHLCRRRCTHAVAR